MSKWKIWCMNGLDLKWEKTITGQLSHNQILTLLQRLASRDLTEEEIIDASLPKNKRNSLLERVGTDAPICVGEHLQYYANKE